MSELRCIINGVDLFTAEPITLEAADDARIKSEECFLGAHEIGSLWLALLSQHHAEVAGFDLV
jgi:hypothetical protein